ncbi:MAG: Potassium channel [Pycnora praestabilis]|nr:MAG: Potassium channel [Pycnora praestabilis]
MSSATHKSEDNVPAVEKREEYARKDEEEAEEDYLAPSRWWFSSTLLPLVAGTFGPMASAFNICALAQDWRIVVDPSSSETEGMDISDPRWLIAINAVSLVIAIIANLALLSHMGERISFAIAQPITIIGWYIAAFLLIGLVAAAPAHLPLAGEPRTFSQAYYYAILAAIVYIIIASMMVFTMWGSFIGRYSRDFKLTTSQRTLMIQTITFLGYILASGAVYARIEGWAFLDAVYWSVVVLFTIGFGDLSPKTHLGRGLFFPFAIGGILFVGLIIASIRALVLERGTKKVSVRTVEKTRQKALQRLKDSPIYKQDAGDKSELDRREQEFNVMRSIQDQAHSRKRWMALGISLGLWCSLWFIGAVVFWQAEKSTQNWSYFESLYFSYVSLITVGFGDFYPQDNSSKPFFVFWALLALPTITVLIGSIGDTIIVGVDKLIIRVGDWSVGPDESGPLANLKRTAAKDSKGKGSKHQSAKPPGFMSKERPEEANSEEVPDTGASTGQEAVATNVEDGNDSDVEKELKEGNIGAPGSHYRNHLLMEEIRKVIHHTNATPPRKYTFVEWAWFLKLLGEDEATTDNHRRPVEVQRSEANKESQGEMAQTEAKNGEVKPWSWLGQKSPLMSNTDEAEWVLERLTATLAKELRNRRHERPQDI